MVKEKVIAVIGGTIWGNRGAESMLVTTIGQLREKFPGARFNVFSYYPAKDRSLVTDDHITILSGKPVSLVTRHFIGAIVGAFLKAFGARLPKGEFFKIARALAASDVLLDIGGITFSDGREKYLPFNILSIWPAMMLGVPVVKMAQAAGPFNNPINHFFAKIFLPRCRHIFARGEKTTEYLRDLGIQTSRLDTVADIAFLYDAQFTLSNENEDKISALLEKLEKIKTKKIIAVSPSILVMTQSDKIGQDYSKNLLEIISQIGTKNYHFVFLPNATREGSEKKQNNDLLIIKKIKKDIESSSIFTELASESDFIAYDINTRSIRKLINKADILITSRYHSMISALCLGVPPVVVGWGHKYEETLAAFGLEDYHVDYRNITESSRVIHQALEKRKEMQNRIQKNLNKIENDANRQFSWLAESLL